MYLGSDAFVETMQAQLAQEQSLADIPKTQTLAPRKSLSYYAKTYLERDEALAQAYDSGHYTLKEVGTYFGVSYATVSRAVKKQEQRLCQM